LASSACLPSWKPSCASRPSKCVIYCYFESYATSLPMHVPSLLLPCESITISPHKVHFSLKLLISCCCAGRRQDS
jgi:hypothetical protein